MIGLVDQVARDHLLKLRIKDEYISAACPFHKGGSESHPSFWIHRETGRWGCFSCHVGGGSIKYLLRELGISSRKIEAELAVAEEEAEKTHKVYEAKRKKKAVSEFKGVYTLPDALLGVYDMCQQAMLDSGFEMSVLQEHDIGYDQDLNRVTFPIRDIYGTLIGISGRSVDHSHPKYLVYSGRRVTDGHETQGELGAWYPDYSNEGVKDHLWRGNFVYPELFKNGGDLIIVEGYKAALWLYQQGWWQVVALMGSKLSKGQERVIRRLGVPTYVLLDNNQPGLTGAEQTCRTLAVSTFPVYRCYYPEECDEDTQPDNLSREQLETVFSQAVRAGGRLDVRHSRSNASSRRTRPATRRPGKWW
jgi:DNA primase